MTDVGDMRDIGDAKRLTLLASLIHECRTSARDGARSVMKASAAGGRRAS